MKVVERLQSVFRLVKHSRVCQALRARYNQLSRPVQRRVRIAFAALGALVVIQLCFPSSLMLPNTRIAGKNYSLKSRSSTLADIQAISQGAKVTVQLATKNISSTMQEMGVAIDAPKTLAPVQSYPWYWRFIPFTIFTPHSSSDYALRSVQPAKTKSFVDSLKQFDIQPTNAGIKMEGQTPTLIASKKGISYSGGNQQQFIQKARLNSDFVIHLSGETTKPKISDTDAKQIAETIQKQLKTQFTVSVENQVSTVSPETLASWITAIENQTKDKLTISYNTDKIKAYLQPYADKVYEAGVARKVTTLDGVITSQIDGSPGRAMKLDASINEVVKALTNAQGSAKTIIQAFTPTIVVSASYTRSSKGLQALLNDWVKNHKGSYNIALRTTAGDISANYNGGGKIYPASIYKLFVADVAYNKAASGQLDLNAATPSGNTYAGCIELMIVRSDNTCAYEVGDAVGWDANNGFLSSQGFGSTTLKKHVWTTTANDISSLLLKLQGGSLIRSDYQSVLLSMMSRQIYRSGIPAGSSGGVADKVGFIDSYNHDAGIVYHPNGSYALVIMTTNSSFSNIADLSRQISNVMKQ